MLITGRWKAILEACSFWSHRLCQRRLFRRSLPGNQTLYFIICIFRAGYWVHPVLQFLFYQIYIYMLVLKLCYQLTTKGCLDIIMACLLLKLMMDFHTFAACFLLVLCNWWCMESSTWSPWNNSHPQKCWRLYLSSTFFISWKIYYLKLDVCVYVLIILYLSPWHS